ncbi:MAG: Spermine synthase [uncultured bacterium]|uniref:PABS domain-containing protein n=1 Tax=Candidatus Gottesmanbacteria bacterium RIFCSPLOWO2_01_FULL_43_11b TaxID=1798392 RepID=A0A1F6AIW2_9BACT|nr:MAG: Spermine synthase [uncultured bacterium]OGG24373.1 MAG: hypothetical protein A3A79_04280 [Candidatus Gottesmanbacteria bacterium RIFCSPLOWO2_01_FULL_43_11b]
MDWRSYIYPQTIERFSTVYNHDIRVVEDHGKLKILVNGSPQSGPYIEKLWKNALRSFGFPKKIVPKSILVLGIAGGTVIHLLHQWYPEAKITAVDIDQTMIDIGKKYFELGKIKNLILKKSDANTYVQKKSAYDIIIVDLSFGREIPVFVTTRKFLSALKKIRMGEGIVVINFLREKEYKEISGNLKKILVGLFPIVRDKQLFLNRFFMAS